MYCLCSNASFEEIFNRQRSEPLPRQDMIDRHTGCTKGCGSCIDELVAEAEKLELLPDTAGACPT